MPKEAEPSSRENAPLRRGDACLYCRKRRIKCSAEKPSCNHCRGKRECSYDNGKPVSRVKQLEDKVAQLEELLQSGAGASGAGSRRPSDEAGKEREFSRSGSGSTNFPQSSASAQVTPGSFDTLNTGGSNGQGGLYQGGSSGAFSFEGSGMDGIDTFDINAIQQSFTQATSGLSNDFFSFGGSMFGNPSTLNPPPTISSTSLNQATMFDFSTLDPNFMSLVNSFEDTFQSQSQAPAQPQPQSQQTVQPIHQPPPPRQLQQQSQSSMFAATVADDTSTGLTPYLNQDYSPLASVPSPNTSNEVPPVANVAAPTPGRHFEHLSQSVAYHARPDQAPLRAPLGEPTWNTLTGNATPPASQTPSSGTGSDHPLYPKAFAGPNDTGADVLLSQALGDKSPADPSAYSAQIDTSYSLAFQKPADSRAGFGAALDQEGYELVGGWFDANDLPRVARDHLLDLFFSGMRMFAQIFHIPRFFASLTMQPSKRPHPCLLYTMYLLASRISSSPSIRALETHFATIASQQLDESIAKADRLFDATRAACILATYKYSNARYHEGWMMIGLAARLAISCGLHQISSSVFKPSTLPRDRTADLISLIRQRTFVLPPPADPIELGERIGAFWSIFTTERCGSISAQWPPSISDDVITTPYPKPLHEYELGLVTEADDQSISTLYDPSPPRQTLPHYGAATESILRLRALAILERSSKLMYLKPEPEFEQFRREQSQSVSPAAPIDEYLYNQNVNINQESNFFGTQSPTAADVQSSASSQGKAWMRCAKIRTPKAYAEVKLALEKVEVDLPPERRTDWTMWDGRIQQWHFTASRMDNYTLHFILGVSWMFLFDVFAYNSENTDAVNVARRLTQTIRSMKMNVAGLGGDFDVFIAMTWSFISKILIREVKRLQAKGDHTGAAEIELDVEVIIQALKMFGQRYSIAGVQAMRAERYRKSTVDEMKFMEREDLDNGLEQADLGC